MENISASNQLDDYPNAASENFFEHSNYYTFLVTYIGYTKGRKVSKRNRNRDSLRIINKETERKKEKTRRFSREVFVRYSNYGEGEVSKEGVKIAWNAKNSSSGLYATGLQLAMTEGGGGGNVRDVPRGEAQGE